MSQLTQQDAHENASMGNTAEMAGKATAKAVELIAQGLQRANEFRKSIEARRREATQNIAASADAFSTHSEARYAQDTQAEQAMDNVQVGDIAKSIVEQYGKDDGNGGLVYEGEKYDFKKVPDPETGTHAISISQKGDDYQILTYEDNPNYTPYAVNDVTIRSTESLVDNLYDGNIEAEKDERIELSETLLEQSLSDKSNEISANAQVRATTQNTQYEPQQTTLTPIPAKDTVAEDAPKRNVEAPAPVPKRLPNEGREGTSEVSQPETIPPVKASDAQDIAQLADIIEQKSLPKPQNNLSQEDASKKAEVNELAEQLRKQNEAKTQSSAPEQAAEDSQPQPTEQSETTPQQAAEDSQPQSTAQSESKQNATYSAEKYNINRTEDNTININDKQGKLLFSARKNEKGSYDILADNMSREDRKIFKLAHKNLKEIGKEKGVQGGLETVMKDPSARLQARNMGSLAPEGSKAIAFVSNKLDELNRDSVSSDERDYSRAANNAVSIKNRETGQTLVESTPEGEIKSSLNSQQLEEFSVAYGRDMQARINGRQKPQKSQKSQKSKSNNDLER